jgi:DNA (cytosine-5)-methyltransferase 1
VLKPRLLDLFCGAGGGAMGYARAGFEVVGVDIAPQPRYPFRFYEDDALDFLRGYLLGVDEDPRGLPWDAIHASPPCQAHTAMSNRWRGAGGLADERPNLIGETRRLLLTTGLPYVIENVPGARKELRDPVQLCGRSLGLTIHRHRLFETNFPLLVPGCPGGTDEFGIYGKAHDGRRLWTRKNGSVYRAAATLEEAQDAMEMPWAEWHGVKEAIPPAMTELVGTALMAHLRQKAAA